MKKYAIFLIFCAFSQLSFADLRDDYESFVTSQFDNPVKVQIAINLIANFTETILSEDNNHPSEDEIYQKAYTLAECFSKCSPVQITKCKSLLDEIVLMKFKQSSGLITDEVATAYFSKAFLEGKQHLTAASPPEKTKSKCTML